VWYDDTFMRITVNGETREIMEGQSVAALLADLGIQDERVAVELNLTILNREYFKQTVRRDGDRVEVIGFIGGGRGLGHE
jgi:thiamine biosynthesis protein ThiS